MKQVTIEKFSGLAVQPNSFTVRPGTLERADNAVLSQDNIISKRRGARLHHTFQTAQVIGSLFDYQTSVFAVSQNTLYRLIAAAVTAQAVSLASSTSIVVRKTAHGLRDQDYIADFNVTNSDDFVAAFPDRHGAFYGQRQITTGFTVAATRATNVVTVTLPNHGLTTGMNIAVTASTISVAAGTYAITVINSNTFEIASVGSNSTGTLTFTTSDAFRIAADQSATVSVVSGATAANYRRYTVQTGASVSVTSSGVVVSRAVASNKNLYFTTDNGVLKLEREDLPVLEAGIPPGLDLQGELGQDSSGANTGPILPNGQVAYRILFGRRDANNNLILGAPSEAIVLRNNVISLTSGLSYDNPSNVLTITSTAHGLISGDNIFLYNVIFAPTTETLENGTRIEVTVIDANTFSIDLDDVMDPTLVTGVTSLDYGVAKTARLTFTIPSEILSTEYIFQVYRSPQTTDVTTLPEPRYKQVEEGNITSGQVSAGFVDVFDELDDALISGNAELYTNPTQEGELQANARPPRAEDVALFKGYVFYANITQFRTLDFAVVAPNLITNADVLTIGAEEYIFRGNASNEPVGNDRTDSSATWAANVATITQTNHGFLTGDTINVLSSTFSLETGVKTITVTGANTFTFASTTGGASGTVEYEGLADTSGRRLVRLSIVYSSPNSPTLSEAIALTARALLKAINRNADATIYAQYVSAPDAAPGKLFFIAKNVNAVSYAVTISNSAATQAFIPDVPTSGTAVSDTQEAKPNELAIAKLQEPEAVPISDRIAIGSESAAILRIAPLRDSLIILKEDGVFRLNGDSKSNFSVTAVDNTVICVAKRSVAVLNNSVYALTNQGVVQITDSSVPIISRPIEPYFSSIIGIPGLEAVTSGVGYESERLYLLSTVQPNTSVSEPNITYCYNYLTDSWTTWRGDAVVFLGAHLGMEDDKLYFIEGGATNLVHKERKNQNKVDFSGQEYATPIIAAQVATAVAVAGTATVTATTIEEHGLAVGDLITVSRSSSALGTGFSGGVSDVDGLRIVTAIPDTVTFQFAAATVAVGSATGLLYAQLGLSEADVACSVSSGSVTVTITTAQSHGLVTGNPITVNRLSVSIAGAFPAETDLTGYRSVSVVSATVFTIQASNNATGNATGTVNISDRRANKTIVTLRTLNGIVPQAGDAIVTDNRLYKVKEVARYDVETYVLTLFFAYKSLSTADSFLHSAYNTSLKFAPLTAGNVGMLKQFGEFQAVFRNGDACTQMRVNFSNDGFVSDNNNAWNFGVGSDLAPVQFGGWGSLEWGQFPWGGETSLNREFQTRPAVILRQYVPMKTYIGTFLQPILDHRVAGEAIELQAMAIFHKQVTNRTSR
jgi:hypothetical protein